MRSRPLFTVFTPTFNRVHTLDLVYASISSQTLHDLEWLIVDDGSTDGTERVVAGWQRESSFPIRYYRQENRGKCWAVNRGVKLAEGEFFLIWDSDDEAVPEALERFRHHWNAIPSEERCEFTGVSCLCRDHAGNIVGDRFPVDGMDSNELDMHHRYKVMGEKWGFHRTEVLKRFPFPEVQGVDFIPESFVWHAIATQYKKRFVNEALRVYHQPTFDAGRLSAITTRDPGRHAAGRRLYYWQKLNRFIPWARYDVSGFFRVAINYVRFSIHCGVRFRNQWQELTNGLARTLFVLSWPMGLAMYLVDKRS